VPVLVDNAALPAASDLPPDIKNLASRQYVRLNPRSADRDLRHLVDELAQMLEGHDAASTPVRAGEQWPASVGRYAVDLRDAKGVIVGDGAIQSNTFTELPGSGSAAAHG
jgi:hypothetical protein